MEKFPTSMLVWSVLRSHLREVPGDLVVWVDNEVEFTAAEMLAFLSLSELSQPTADIVVRWYSSITYTTLLRYRRNEQV